VAVDGDGDASAGVLAQTYDRASYLEGRGASRRAGNRAISRSSLVSPGRSWSSLMGFEGSEAAVKPV
jgi:hypothetical protein